MNPESQSVTRRSVLAAAGGAAVAAAVLGSRATQDPTMAQTAPRTHVPADDAPHTRTWMAWPASRGIWGNGLSGVQRDIAVIASTIAQFEPVTMCANPASAKAARRACGSAVKVIESIAVDDLWMRDTAPIFRVGHDDRLVDAVGLNFNGWGKKQKHRKDRWVAQEVADHVGVPFTRARFVGEGGAIETDGVGTLLATVSSLVNSNRNPGMTKAAVEHAMVTAYGARKVVWVPGVRGRDITDDHVDSTCRFVRPGVVIVQVPPADRRDIWSRTARRQLRTLEQATDAHGRSLQIVRLAGPHRVRSRNPDFLDSYVNFAVVNGAVIAANFGDPHTDALARDTLGRAFPGREVVQLNVDHLHSGGGGIHCSTMQQPK